MRSGQSCQAPTDKAKVLSDQREKISVLLSIINHILEDKDTGTNVNDVAVALLG